MRPKVVCIIPARSDSRRFPKKHLEQVGKYPLIGILITRMKSLELIDEIVVATTNRKCDDELSRISESFGAKVFRGSLKDVIGRFTKASKKYKADICIKANGDNPMQCPEVIELSIKQLLLNKLDIVTGKNTFTNLPIGIGAEVITFETVKWLDENTIDEFREDTTSYVYNYETPIKVEGVRVPNSWTQSTQSITVDTSSDMLKLKKIISMLPNTKPQFWKILEIIGAMNRYEKV